MRDKIIWLGGQGENRNGFTFRTRAWRVAPCRRLRRILKNHTKCVPSHLILRMKNSESEGSLAVDCRGARRPRSLTVNFPSFIYALLRGYSGASIIRVSDVVLMSSRF